MLCNHKLALRVYIVPIEVTSMFSKRKILLILGIAVAIMIAVSSGIFSIRL